MELKRGQHNSPGGAAVVDSLLKIIQNIRLTTFLRWEMETGESIITVSLAFRSSPANIRGIKDDSVTFSRNTHSRKKIAIFLLLIRMEPLKRTMRWSGTTKSEPRTAFWCSAKSSWTTNANYCLKWVFAFFLFIFVFAEKFEFLKFSIFPPLFVAINRHSTHPKNQLTRIELQRDKATSRSRTQHSIRTRMEEQMEKWQTTQMVSVWPENESGREKNFLTPCTSALNSSDNAFVSP